MPSFNEPAVTAQPADYTNSSQGPRASSNDALGELFSNAAQIADVGIKEADRQKRSDIMDDILVQTEGVQDEFGVGSATDTEVDAESSAAGARPPALEKAYENLERLQNANEKGALKDWHYWARLNVMVRQLRAKYPGYRQDIDGMVASVVGARPANALRSALFSEWESAAADKANSPLAKLEDWAVKDGTLPPDYFERKQNGDPYSLIELQSEVANKTRIKAETAARQAELSAKISTNTVTTNEMEQSYRVDSQQFVYTLLGDTSKMIGKDWVDLNAKVREAQRQMAAGVPVNAVEIQKLIGIGSQLKMEAMAALEAQFMKPFTNDPSHSYVHYIDNQTKQEIIQQAMAPIDNILTSLNGTNNPYSVLNSTTAWIEANKTQATSQLLKTVPLVANMAALTDLAGPDATGLMLEINPDVNNALTKSLLDFSVTQGSLGQGSITDALDKGVEGGQKADYFNALSEGWQKISTMIDSGEVPLEVIQNNVQYMFGQDNTAVLSKLDPQSRIMWFNKVASPEVTRQMLKLKKAGDEQSWNTYQNWVKGGFVNIYAQEMNALNAANDMMSNPASALGGIVAWDKTTSSFKIATVDRPRTGMVLLDAAMTITGGFQNFSWGGSVNNINAAIQVVKPIIMENGGDVEKELATIMAAMGFDGAQGIQGAMFEQLLANTEFGERPEGGE